MFFSSRVLDISCPFSSAFYISPLSEIPTEKPTRVIQTTEARETSSNVLASPGVVGAVAGVVVGLLAVAIFVTKRRSKSKAEEITRL